MLNRQPGSQVVTPSDVWVKPWDRGEQATWTSGEGLQLRGDSKYSVPKAGLKGSGVSEAQLETVRLELGEREVGTCGDTRSERGSGLQGTQATARGWGPLF